MQSDDTRLSGFNTTPGSVRLGGALWDSVTVLPKAARAITVQYRRAGTGPFTSRPTVTTSPRGGVTLGLQPPAAGTWQFRAIVAATGRFTRFVSSTRTVVASGRALATSINGFAATSATVSPGRTVTDNVVISPRASRVVVVQARRPGSTTFVTQSKGTSSSTGSFRAVYRPSSAGVWRFRLAVRATATARAVTSPRRVITVVNRTAPGPVTGLKVKLAKKAAILTWTNPAADFTGAVIRRALGDSAPATANDGDEVADLPAPADTFTDAGLTPDTEYSYAVFAHDGAHNYAAAAITTVTTLPPTAAVLSVHPLGLPNNKLTVNATSVFDASGSFADDGMTLESGTLDYGDGSQESFTEFGQFDFWNSVHSYQNPGQMTVTLTVRDSAGNTDTTTTTVTVFDAPTTSVRVASGPPRVGVPVRFALDASTAAGAGIDSSFLTFSGEESFYFRYGAAPPANQLVTLTFPGTYTVAFSVADDAGGAPAASEIVIDVAP